MVCENTKNLLEAAQLYERSGLAEKAASIYINLKLFQQATPLISKIKSPKLLIQLAKVFILDFLWNNNRQKKLRELTKMQNQLMRKLKIGRM